MYQEFVAIKDTFSFNDILKLDLAMDTLLDNPVCVTPEGSQIIKNSFSSVSRLYAHPCVIFCAYKHLLI